MIESQNTDRNFSIELRNKGYLKKFNLANGGSEEPLLIEGNLGKLKYACFEEDLIFEVACQEGILRINLQQHEIRGKSQNAIEGLGTQ